ncbi:porin, partial [Thioclava sp. BHET1]
MTVISGGKADKSHQYISLNRVIGPLAAGCRNSSFRAGMHRLALYGRMLSDFERRTGMTKPMTGCAFGAAILVALGATLPAQAKVTPLTFSGPDATTVTFYGQINAGVVDYDDGQDTHIRAGNNANSSSRLGFTIDKKTDAGKLQFRFETGLGFVSTSGYSQTSDPDSFNWNKKQLRKVELSYEGNFGKISAGQGSMATDGVAEVDQSDTAVIGYSSIGDLSGGYLLRRDNGALTSTKLSSVFKDTDGSRYLRLRYDTPEFDGFSVAAAYGKDVLDATDHNRYYDLAVNWHGDVGQFKVKSALGYSWTDPRDGSSQGTLLGSVSVLHSSGLNLTLSGGSVNDGGEYGYAKLGYIAHWLPVGETAIAAEYYHSTGFGGVQTGRMWGV